MITILLTFTPISKAKASPHGMHLMSLDSIIGEDFSFTSRLCLEWVDYRPIFAHQWDSGWESSLGQGGDGI